MTDLLDRDSQDGEHIHLDDPQDTRFWMSEFEVSETELRHAVEAVGVKALAVRAHLARRFTRF